MKKIATFLIAFLLVGYVVLQFKTPQVFSYSSSAPAGYSGSPADGVTCATSGCHSSYGAAQPKTGWITSNAPAGGYVAGTTYTITATATYAGRTRFGFEVSPQNTAGNLLGTLTSTSTATTTVGGGKYIGHTSSGLSGSGSRTWTFNWTAPAAGTGAVTFYGVFNCSNSDGGSGGDYIYTSTLTIQEAAAVGTDAGISNTVFPVSQACSTTFSPQVTLKNYGATTLTNVTINSKLDGGAVSTYNWTGNLASNASTVVTLNSVTTSAGTHTFDAYTSSPNGGTDGNPANDAATQTSFSIATVASLPFTEGFEGTTFPPTGWTILDPDVANANNATWARTTTAASTGSASAKLDIFNASSINGQHDAMVTPPVNLSLISSATLTFDVAYAYYTSPLQFSDTLIVWASTDCGVTYTQVYRKAGDVLKTAPPTTSAFVPTANQWRTETIDLTAYTGSNVVLKFECVNDWENNLYIDNVNLIGVVTGIDNAIAKSQLIVYPSPSTGRITIDNLTDGANILIYSQLGKLVKSFANTNQKYFDLSNLKDGIYFIQIQANNTITTKKVILAK